MHSIFSDGCLLPSEIAQRASVLGYEAIAITDHVDSSNLKSILTSIVSVSRDLNREMDLRVIPGVEITHPPISLIDTLAHDAKRFGAQLVIVHGETLAEPVHPQTNLTSLRCEAVDVLAHPGLLTEEEARLAEKNGIYLELSAHPGHCLSNGHVARLAERTGAKLILNTDLHRPEDFLTQEQALRIAMGAGLGIEEALKAIRDNPRELVKRASERD
jgi:putative hydrolase